MAKLKTGKERRRPDCFEDANGHHFRILRIDSRGDEYCKSCSYRTADDDWSEEGQELQSPAAVGANPRNEDRP